jgi:hypothetical protein
MWEEVAPKVMLREGFFGLNMAKRLMMSSVSQLCVTCTLCGPSSSSLGTLPPGSSQRNGMSFSLSGKASRAGLPSPYCFLCPGFGVCRGRGVGTAGSNYRDWGLEKLEEKR